MDFIDIIYIINLDERKDRWEHAIKQIEKYNLIHKVKRFNAIKINNLSNKELNNLNHDYKPKNKLFLNNLSYIHGSYGCKKSHLNILELHKNDVNKKILILEDDFLLTENFIIKLEKLVNEIKENKLDNFKIFNLGYTLIKNKSKYYPINENSSIIKLNKCYGSFAYIINSNFITEFIDICTNKCKHEIDNCLVYSQNKYDIYGCNPALISHFNTYSNINNKFVDYNKELFNFI